MNQSLFPTAIHETVAAAKASVDSGRIDQAIEILEEALRLRPDVHEIRGLLGALHLQGGDLHVARTLLLASVQSFPLEVDHWVNLASCNLALGSIKEALAALKKAHELSPTHLGAWLALAKARMLLGDIAGAERCLRTAESISPDLPHRALFHLAGLLQERKAFEESKAYYSRAIQLAPESVLYRTNFADLLCNIGEIDEGVSQHRVILSREPHRLRSHLAIELTLPGVHASLVKLHKSREDFAEGLERLHQLLPEFKRLPTAVIESDVRWSNYLLAYQGGDDRSLQERFSAFQHSVLASLFPQEVNRKRGRNTERIRIGFASSFFYQCTVGWYFSSWIQDLSRKDFEVFIYSLGPTKDELTADLARESQYKQVHHLPLFQLVRMILDDELDVLVFPELGLCPTTFTLACMRLAPLQCAGWGHPVTSGHATVDVYFSSALMEPEGAEAHYRERLIRLPGLGTRYSAALRPPKAERARFGFDANTPLALVSQSLFKIHPDNDSLYLAIKERMPSVKLLFFEDSFSRNTVLFSERLKGWGLKLSRDFVFLPRMGRSDFLAINQMADVMLDTLHWSGGNTSLDALSVGLPIVTQPGRFMRSRQSSGMLSAIGGSDWIVSSNSDYVELACATLAAPSRRPATALQLSECSSLLFNQAQPTLVFATWIKSLIEERRG